MSLSGGRILILSSENVDQLWEIGISSELSILDRWDVYSDLKDTALVWHLWQGRKTQNVWWVRSTSLNRVMIVWWKWWWKWPKTYDIMTSSNHTISIREAIIREKKDFLWNHFIKWWPPPVPLLWSPYLFFFRPFFERKKRWFWRLFEGCWWVF